MPAHYLYEEICDLKQIYLRYILKGCQPLKKTFLFCWELGWELLENMIAKIFLFSDVQCAKYPYVRANVRKANFTSSSVHFLPRETRIWIRVWISRTLTWLWHSGFSCGRKKIQKRISNSRLFVPTQMKRWLPNTQEEFIQKIWSQHFFRSVFLPHALCHSNNKIKFYNSNLIA